MSVVWGPSGGGGGGVSDIKDAYETVATQTSNYTVTGEGSVIVPVDTTGGIVSITLPSGVANQRVMVVDAGDNAGTNPITIVGTVDGSANPTIESDGGSAELVFIDSAWESLVISGRYFQRDSAANEISTREPDTLVANKLKTPQGGTGVEILDGSGAVAMTVDENGKITSRTAEIGSAGAAATAGVGLFSNAGANIDQQVGDWGNVAAFSAEVVIQSTDETDGAIAFSNLSSSGIAVSRVGTVEHDTAQAKFDTSSIRFNGGSDLLALTDASLGIGSGDFVTKFWFRADTTVAGSHLIGNEQIGGSGWSLRTVAGGSIMQIIGDGLSVTPSVTINPDTWYYCEFGRSGGTARLFIDGIEQWNAAWSTTITGANNIHVGWQTASQALPFIGWMEDIYFNNGEAVSTVNYSPPVAPVAPDAYATTNNTFDVTQHNGAATSYAPSTLEVRDENDLIIFGDTFNIDYALNGGPMTGSPMTPTAFRALDASIFASLTQLVLELQPIGDERISESSISTPNNSLQIGSDGVARLLNEAVEVGTLKDERDQNQTGTTYTLVLNDEKKVVFMDNASANTVTIPTNAAVAFSVGAKISILQEGAGVTTIQGDTGVTLNGVSAGSVAINNQYQAVTIMKRATDSWVAVGDYT